MFQLGMVAARRKLLCLRGMAKPVLAHALQWAVNTAPKVVKRMGGEEMLHAKIFAALHLEPDASAAALGVATTA